MNETSDRELVVSRVFDAPRELVFDAWLDARNIGRWWGPNGFSTTTYEMHARPGGVWRYTMHGPDGTDYPNYVTYTEIERPARIAYDHGTDAEHPAEFLAVATFVDLGDKTEVTLRLICQSPEQLREYVKFGAVEGGQQTLARLADHLATLA